MDKSNKNTFDLFSILKSWIPKRSKSANVSRDFWMPDNSCRVCYECDAQFTLFNRRHHCRICGRIFCAKCTTNSVPLCSLDTTNKAWDEWEKVRVCNYCFRQWEQGLARVGTGAQGDSGQLPLAASINSSKSIGTAYDSTITICTMSFGLCEQFSDNFSLSAYQSEYQSAVMDPFVDAHGLEGSGNLNVSDPCMEDSSIRQFVSSTNRGHDDNDDAYGVYQLESEASRGAQANGYYGPVEFSGTQSAYQSQDFVPDVDNCDIKSLNGPAFQDNYDMQDADELQQHEKKEDHYLGDECEAPSSLCAAEDVNIEPVDFENNGLLWLPPEPENEEDEREAGLFDDDDDGDAAGEWGQLRSSGSFGSAQHRRGGKCGEEHKKAVKSVVDGHFRALVSQLLQVENISVSDDDLKESWLEIITALSWEAATLLKPDTSRGGGMDPGGYVKVKCLASGHRSDSTVIKGVVCKKNVAHRRMATRIEKPRVMILGGALEYQRVSNHLSSFDTLLQQERDHLKMAVAKIDAHHPNVLLVEKGVSRCAQEYILAKDISLVLNIKKPLLERIARCTGAQIVPSIDHLSAQKMGHCEVFHVDKCFEDHGSAGQSGKKLTKTLMYFEGCPKPLGCTIILRGADGDELKKVKHVVQYGVFAAYHLALETSFLADERATLPEVPLTVALPNKALSIDRSISLVPGFTVLSHEKLQNFGDPHAGNAMDGTIASDYTSIPDTELIKSLSMPAIPVIAGVGSSISSGFIRSPLAGDFVSEVGYDKISSTGTAKKDLHIEELVNQDFSTTPLNDHPEADGCAQPCASGYESISEDACNSKNVTVAESISWQQDAKTTQEEVAPSKEEFPPSPSDEQSILVSLSSRCVWKGTVCERSHLFRIKYYGSFDKPLGRFLQDNLFDQNYKCPTCEMPSEAHVHCYTHRQGTLTISVKKLQIILPGEQEGKIWMWHRCLRCPRTGGFPPATLRVLMSDAAWGLSFGKFLELSFSNHAAASRVASCGHSLHRDCLRFYGSGRMVACFRYASINVFSVYLPPSKLEFNYDVQDWLQREADEVVQLAEFLFSEVLNGIGQIAEKRCGGGTLDTGVISHESRNHISELKGVLQNERTEFEEMHRKILNGERKRGHPAIDILEINRLRRQLLFQSYMWDHRLVYAASLDDDSHPAGCMSSSDEKTVVAGDVTVQNIITGSSNAVTSSESLQVDADISRSYDVAGKIENAMNPPEMAHQIEAPSSNLNCGREDQRQPSVCPNVVEEPVPLECGSSVRRTLSDSEFVNLSDTLDAHWTGKSQTEAEVSKDNSYRLMNSISVDSSLASVAEKLAQENPIEERNVVKMLPPVPLSPSPAASANPRSSDTAEDTKSWLGMPFLNFYRSFNKNFLGSSPKLDTFGGYNPMYVSSVGKLGLQGGAKWLLPVGINETVVPVYDDEPTSIIAYALMSEDYYSQLSEEAERAKEITESSFSLPLQESASFHQFLSLDESILESCRSLSIDESILSTSGPRNYSTADPLLRAKSSHIRISFTDHGPLDKVKYTVICYYAKHFDALRKICCSSELDFVRSLSRCKKWGAQGGKSNVFFAKTLDDRFIIKQVTKTELESFIKFGPEYFKYLTESISSKSPTCLAKILGIYQVATKNLKGGKESKMDVLVMENLLFRRNVTRLYDLKGSSRSRYNPDTTGSNKVLLDQNLIEAMPTSPIFVGNKAKRLLERAVWNDTSLLASIDVMDYSLLVGVDEEKHELVVGIIDFMRQYTWDKHLETWVKASGILGGPKNVSPTVISPDQYKKRFRKAMTAYFLMVPDQWSPPTLIPSRSQTNLCEENPQLGSSVE